MIDLPLATAPKTRRFGSALDPRGELLWRLATYAAVVLFAIGWTLALGPDIHWDALNYHVYLGFSALHNRFAQDFFAAGPPSYLNPYAYVPLYLASSAGIPAIVVATGFAIAHSAALCLVYEIARTGMAGRPAFIAPTFSALAVVFAATNPILLQSVGTTFSDLLVGALVVAAWLAAARGILSGSLLLAAVAGVFGGAAAALKLSNAIFAVAAFAMLAFWPGSPRKRLGAATIYGAACFVAFCAVALPWSAQLWREFGNPFFPFFNEWFRSPDFTAEPLRYERFIPASLAEGLARPFVMLSATGYVHTEPRAPDIRYVALLVALGIWLVTLGRSRGERKGPDGQWRIEDRVLWALVAAFGIAWCLWLGLSGNSRYFLPMACVASAIVAMLAQRLHARWKDATTTVVAIALLIQCVQVALGADWKRAGREWDGPWLSVEVPERLRSQPYLYLSLGFQTGSALAPFLHPHSGLVNISGFQVLSPGHPGGERTSRLIAEHLGRVRMLMPLSRYADERQAPSRAETMSIIVARFGLRIDPRDCEFVRISGELRGAIEGGRSTADKQETVGYIRFLSCAVAPAPGAAQRYAERMREIDGIFDRVEDTCPRLFHPRRAPTELRSTWVRTYNMGSEVHLWIEGDRLKYFRPIPGGDPIDIGTVEQWRNGVVPFDCTKKTAPAFGGVLE